MTGGPADAAARFWRAAGALGRTPDAACRYGETPRDAVMAREGATLHRYRAEGPRRTDAAPLLVVHGLIGRAEVVDLDPSRSLVRALLAQGFDVWMIHWGKPGRAERWLRFEDYALDRLGAFAARVGAQAGRAPVVMGLCAGGLFALCLAARTPGLLAGLALAVTPVDCHADPDAGLTRLVRSLDPDTLTRLIDQLGGLPGPAMAAAFQNLTPRRTLEKYTLDLLRLGGDAEGMAHFLRMERWLADRPDHPAEAAKQLLVEIYHRNALARGAFDLDGAPVNLGAIRTPTLSILGLRDHLVPPACALAAGRLLGGPHRALALDAGHIGVFVSRRARGAVAAALAGFLADPAGYAAGD